MCVFPVCVTAANKARCVAATLLCVTYYLSVYHTHVHENTNTGTHTHTHTSLPLLPSCEGFDIRLPAADAAAAANANAAQSLKQQ